MEKRESDLDIPESNHLRDAKELEKQIEALRMMPVSENGSKKRRMKMNRRRVTTSE